MLRRTPILLACAAAAVAALPRHAAAQAWFYPSFQTPATVDREYNFAAVSAGGADFLFQWREGLAEGSQLSLDAGLADPKGPSNTRLFVGGQYARELTRATETQPIDVLGTVGAGISFGNGFELFRVPVGVSVGHTFPLEGGMAVTPYVHPRVSLDVASGRGDDRVSLDFDLGAALAITSQLTLRAALIVSGNEAASSTGFGIGLSLSPAPIRPR